MRELDGSVTDLTPGDSLKAMLLGWADDDQTFFVGTNQRGERFFDIYEVSPETYDRTLIYQDETGYELSAISPDKQLLVFSRPNTTNDNDLFLYDRATQEMRHLTPHNTQFIIASPLPLSSRDGHFVTATVTVKS